MEGIGRRKDLFVVEENTADWNSAERFPICPIRSLERIESCLESYMNYVYRINLWKLWEELDFECHLSRIHFLLYEFGNCRDMPSKLAQCSDNSD